MMPNDMIEICRAEYDRLVAALNENKELNETLILVEKTRDATSEANEELRQERDSLNMELKTLRGLFVEKNRKVEELEKEVTYLNGFRHAVEMMTGNQ
jgi:uncharacterized coiled-coil DUF342 family protein